MSNSSLTVDCSGCVARLTLNRPRVHNAFDDELIDSITSALADIAGDESVRVVVLQADGKSFSAGADLGWMRRMAGYGKAENKADAMALAQMLFALDQLPQPVIAKVQGAAIGGGVGLVAAADIAIGVPTAVFSLSEVRLGLVPAVISPYVVRAVGARQARALFLTAERFDGERALEIGLLHHLVDADELESKVDEICTQLLQNGPLAMSHAKRLVDRVAGGAPTPSILEHTATLIADIRASDEGREGIDAFLGKRHASWRKH